ncbi:hypothetical protein ACL03H_14110 [Saccharopolyspora sp. MS10]|uniref:hypothetical protein n=1 Tax=Saccharopolyspora sp. MS10 TaxID=3385973 RepID=UPI0039A28C36
MTGSCAQRTHWPRLRAWTRRALATAGIVGSAWLLGAGIAAASPEPGRAVGGEQFAVEVVPSIDPELLAAAADEDPATGADPAEQLEIADLATDISSDVRERLDGTTAAELVEPAPARETEQPEPEPDGAEPTDAPRAPEPAPAPRAELPPPPPAVSEQAADRTPDPPARHPAPTHREVPPDLAEEEPAPDSHPVPTMPPPAPTATVLSANTSPGHGLRWSHAVLPPEPRLPAAERAAGGHADAATSRGVALIEPSAAPD